ncbi:PREDICTED: NAC domain-containing protein 60-like isoform X1 [Tarenaya hassleriana]|uniref:NAC domain-containing protein 60-like isoform X1 n=1 Tax=Tarenaya hassleriana TaxID=28532 RepID=UPI00053C377D|nr:PREDICTED: NAC domain-containing protein 60-like isoform X1 [Tarenaya hassleriana]
MAGEISNETEKSLASATAFPGFKFSPTDTELISYYLKRKIDGMERCVEVITEVDIYNFEPWDLPDKSIVKAETEWFFFYTRGRKYPHGSQNKRTTQKGFWKATGKERNVKSGAEVIGTKRTLVFYVGRAPKGERTEWIIHEYCMKGVPPDALVVCRLRRNTEFQASSSEKTVEQSLPTDKLATVQNGSSSENISEWENMIDYYLSSEAGQEPINDITESAGQEPIDDITESAQDQAPIDEDFYAEILRDDIVKLDEAVIQGKPETEIPRMQTEATASRVLPLPNILDEEMKTVVQEELAPKTQGSPEHERLSKCLLGSVKTVNRNRWFSGIAVVAVVVMFINHLAWGGDD